MISQDAIEAISDAGQITVAWEAKCGKLEVEIKRLRAIVAKLDKTADGVPWVPHAELWHPSQLGPCDNVEFDDSLGWRVTWLGPWMQHSKATGGTTYSEYGVSECYSSQEAAEAAKAESEGE